jgi:GxxExxY protein
MLHEELSHKILQACFEVSNELGIGFLESVYENALLIALRQKGLIAEAQIDLKVRFRGAVIGDFSVDVLVENKILLELKAVSALAKEHQAQLINYLKATGMEVGMLINFGNPKLEYRRFENKFLKMNSIRDIFSE